MCACSKHTEYRVNRRIANTKLVLCLAVCFYSEEGDVIVKYLETALSEKHLDELSSE